MDHPTPLSRDPWRLTAIVATGVAAFELVLLLMIGLTLLAKPIFGGGGDGDEPGKAASRSAPAPIPAQDEPAPTPPPAQPPAAPPAPPAPATPTLTREEQAVLVLNGNGTSGAAAEKSDLVQTRGYLVTATANASHTDFARSVVMFRPGYRPEAERFARDFQIGRVAPLDGIRVADLQGAHIVLIVGES